MLFSSPEFFLFFLVYLLAYAVTPLRAHVWLVVLGSSVFYARWYPAYGLLPHVLVAMAFFGGLWVADAAEGKRRFVVVICALLGPLMLFKYANFFVAEVVRPLLGLPPGPDVVQLPLPVGISFVTFTLIAYVADTRAGRVRVEGSYGLLAAYTLFFPHMIAGPILRPHELMPQLARLGRRLVARRVLLGLALFSTGLFKKLVIADGLGPVVDRAYADPAALGLGSSLLAIYGFSVQIYCDFSGYSDMALGLARMLGVRLPPNFRSPYLAPSLIDFWRRWHITLSSWLRDYVYIPLGGGRAGLAQRVRNVIITLLLGGLWHGAGWGFLLWGLLHGVGIGATHVLRAVPVAATFLARCPAALKVLVTFHLVTLLWIPFRAPDLESARALLGGLGRGDGLEPLLEDPFPALLILLAFAVHALDEPRRIYAAARRASPLQVLVVIAALWTLALALSLGSSAKFIYFDF